MKVVDNRKEKKKVQFDDLSIGQAYLDNAGCLSIRTNFKMDGNCITFYGDEWCVDTECISDKVTPIEATLTIE